MAVFTVAVSGNCTYQWQYASAGSSVWRSTGATGNRTSELSVLVTANKDGYRYRCVITAPDGTKLFSNEAVLTIG